jgi:carboxyl-terminal processing protease
MFDSRMVSSRVWLRSARHVFMMVALLTVPTAAVWADNIKPIAGNDALHQKWQEGLACLGRGEFGKALTLIHEVAAQQEPDKRVRQVDGWLTAFDHLQNERAERIRKDYEKYVGWVKEATEKKLWHDAIKSANLAYNNATDQEAFRKEPWLAKAVAGAKQAATEYEQDNKWLKAARIYVRLMDMFPRHPEYKEALDRCQAHLRLDYTYAPDADWEASVSNITPDMAQDAFRKIEDEYLTEPDFREAAVAALKHILLMTQESKLARVFKKMENPENLAEFRRVVNARLRMAQDSDELDARDLNTHFERVLKINREIQLFPQTVLIHEFVHGALKPLDPFSDMLWPADLQEFNKHTQGRFSGVGISIHKDPGEPIKVVSPLEDTPAYNAGIQPGDLITRINGQPSNKLTITAAVREITGPAGTTVTLTIKRPSEDREFDVTLERQEITIFTIKGYERDTDGRWKFMVDPENKIAYIRMTNFTEGTIEELRDTLKKLKREEGMRGLVFDLRGNPGGPLKSAVDVSDLFLPADKKIVATRDRRATPWEMSSSSGSEGHFTDFPMIVLVNGSSASASEIVSGALQVHGRALVVGERSFGKGSVQQVLRLNNASMAFLKLTTAKYYLPNDRCLHRDEDSTTWGVDPDVEVKLVPKEVVKVAELRVNSDVLKGKNQKNFTKQFVKSITAFKPSTRPADETDDTEVDGEEDDEEAEEAAGLDREDPNEHPEIDPQMEAAMMLMRVRLESQQPWPTHPPEVAARPTRTIGG